MAKKITIPKVDLNQAFAELQSQFQDLDPKEPGQWPLAPKVMACAAATAGAVALCWTLVLTGEADILEAEHNREPVLKSQYRDKLGQAVNLGELRKQKLQVQEYVTQLERQLPGKAEMDALLSDINQAGLGRSLQFELFRPGSVAVKDYYAELPISIKVTGQYHDVGAFAADVASLSRIVTLHGLNLSMQGASAGGGGAALRDSGGALSMEATARTYRYLDPAEVEAQRKATAKGGDAQGARK
ncbi:type 4a pilus biogenesis protein PilO [Caldimonas tepidiphila]|uniref:type 4a pilus biogenesis protein PilO n=1 Tax=Caldimonas tepidiphila TaxID=2315841 RepID=UPI000E5A531B|nr:type 4a pilus biogenesis protein PilO [Caldimonas tepidiphila]